MSRATKFIKKNEDSNDLPSSLKKLFSKGVESVEVDGSKVSVVTKFTIFNKDQLSKISKNPMFFTMVPGNTSSDREPGMITFNFKGVKQ